MVVVYIVLLYVVSIFLKIFWGLSGDNISLFADGMDSLKHVFTLSMAAYFSEVSRKDKDERHPFGHTRFDSFGAMMIAAFQIFVAGIVMTTSVFKFGQVPKPHSLKDSAFSFLIMLVVTSSVYFYARRRRSESLRAEFWHELSDLLQTGLVLVSTYISLRHFAVANSILALLISVFLLLNGVGTLWRIKTFITDQAPPLFISRALQEVVSRYDIFSLKEEKTLMSAENKVRTELTVQLRYDTSFDVAHDLAHIMEGEIKMRLKELGFEVENIVTHIEPVDAHVKG